MKPRAELLRQLKRAQSLYLHCLLQRESDTGVLQGLADAYCEIQILREKMEGTIIMENHQGPDDFNAMFNRLMNRLKKKRQYTVELGDTEPLQAKILGPEQGERRGSFNIREYKQNPGAMKGRGRFGGIRK